MPEIFRRISKFKSYLAPAISLRSDMDDTAFPLFLREAVDEENGLARLNIGSERQPGAVGVDSECASLIAEGEVVWSSPIHVYGNLEWQTGAAPTIRGRRSITALRRHRHKGNTDRAAEQ